MATQEEKHISTKGPRQSLEFMLLKERKKERRKLPLNQSVVSWTIQPVIVVFLQ